MRLKCSNKECASLDKEEFELHNVQFGFKNGSSYIINKCPVCKKQMLIDISEKEEGPLTCNFMSFNSKPLNEKKRILKKRSNDHFDKHLKDRKEYLDRSALGIEK